jgi:hypothetical protein
VRPSSYFRHAEAGFGERGAIDGELLDSLITSYNLAPQVHQFALVTSQALMQHKRFPEAQAVLQQWVSAVHGDEFNATTSQLLASAKAGEMREMNFYGSVKEFFDKASR